MRKITIHHQFDLIAMAVYRCPTSQVEAEASTEGTGAVAGALGELGLEPLGLGSSAGSWGVWVERKQLDGKSHGKI